MQSLQDIVRGAVRIRDAANKLTITGSTNAELVVYMVYQCNEILRIVDTLMTQTSSTLGQNGRKEADGSNE